MMKEKRKGVSSTERISDLWLSGTSPSSDLAVLRFSCSSLALLTGPEEDAKVEVVAITGNVEGVA